MKKMLLIFFILILAINGCQNKEIKENVVACETVQDCYDSGFCKQEKLPDGIVMEEECDCVDNRCYAGYTSN
ncbi:MAG: hypothetical protein AABW58_04580 [Nanoarchaeota archaeon]